MLNTNVVELNAFVPAKDFEVSKRFCLDLGFEIPWFDETLAYVRFQNASFMLQNFFLKDHRENFVMHLLVESADDWHKALESKGIAEAYNISINSPEDRPWKMRDFEMVDPSGVLWRIGNNFD